MEHWKAFNHDWFARHQKKILWFLNTPIIKHWARWILRIHKSLPKKDKINLITPNSFIYGAKLGKDKLKGKFDARSHPKFSKRIYYAFRPIWWLMHYWDQLIANPFKPEWNLGFDAFGPIYPDATPVTTNDGSCRRFSANSLWSSLRDGAGTVAYDTNASLYLSRLQAGTTSSRWSYIDRRFEGFDLSSISGNTVDDATVSIYSDGKGDGLSITPACHVVSGSPASNTNLVAGDFASVGAATFGNVTYSSYTTSAYNAFTINATGIDYIQTAVDGDGIVYLAFRIGPDYDDAEPSWTSSGNSYYSGYCANQTGTANDPKIEGNWSVPAAGGSPVKKTGRLGITLSRLSL